MIIQQNKQQQLSYIIYTFLEENINFNYYLISYFLFGFLCILFFFKMNIAPFHTWALSVYRYAPIISGFFLNIFLKIIYLLTFVYINLYLVNYLYTPKVYLIIFAAIISCVIGIWGAFYTNEIKLLYIYSTINHLAFMLIPVIFYSFTDTFYSSIEYLIVYLVTSFLLWLFLLMLGQNYKYITNLKNLGNHFLFIFLIIIAFFSLAGIPPLAGFFVKLKVLLNLYKYTFYDVGFLFLILSIISIFYYIRVMKIIFFEKTKQMHFFDYTHIKAKDKIQFIVCVFISIFIIFYFFISQLNFFI